MSSPFFTIECNDIGDNYENLKLVHSSTYKSVFETKDIDEEENNEKILKVILTNNLDKKTVDKFIERIVLIDRTFDNNCIVKYEKHVLNDRHLFIVRQKLNNSLESLEDLEVEMKRRGGDNLISTICGVLKEFHKMSFYHGGIKLSNIFINEDGYLISDHCIKMLYPNNPTITKETVNLYSPEELRCKEIGLEIDLWSFGVLIYKIYIGKYPFEEKNIIQTANRINKEDFPKLPEGFNERLNIILCGLLKKVPKERYTIFDLENEINKMDELANVHIENSDDICIFSNYKRHKLIEISKDGKTITNKKSDGKFHHCFHNIKMDKGVYHLKYKVNGLYNFMFGATSNKEFNGKELGNKNDKTTCSIGIHSQYSNLYGSNGLKITLKKIPIKTIDNGIYEVIYNINKKKMKMIYDGITFPLYSKIPHTPLYPFVGISSLNYKVELLSYRKEDEEKEEEEEEEDDDDEFCEDNRCSFSLKNKHPNILIKNENKLIVNKKCNYTNHICFLDVVMKKYIHHFTFKIEGGCYGFVFGATNENKRMNSLKNDRKTCAINFSYDKVILEGGNGEEALDLEEVNKIRLKEKCEYEIIFNMDEKTMSIKDIINKEEYILFTYLSTRLVPFVGIMHNDCSIELIKYWKENNNQPKIDDGKENIIKEEVQKDNIVKIEELDCCFIKDDNKPFELKNSNKKLIKTDYGFAPCYLNIKLENGIHHFVFRIDGDDEICIGGTNNNKVEDTSLICDDDGTCCFVITSSFVHLCGGNGKKIVEDEYDEIKGVRNDEYEIIFNLNNCSMSMKYKDKVVDLWKDIVFPLYPFVNLFEKDNSIELIKYYKE